MTLTFGVLELLHVVTAVFWVGSSIFLANFLVPTAMAGDENDRRFLIRLAQRSRFPMALGGAGIVTILSGMILLGLSAGGRADFFATPTGLTLALGGLSGIVAYVVGAIVGALNSRSGAAVAASPAVAAQGFQRARILSRTALVFMGLAIVAMTLAPYV